MCLIEALRWAGIHALRSNREISCFHCMVSNAHLRHEGRRCLPRAIRTRNQRVLKHLGLAHCVARRQCRRGPEEHDDLLQEASLGLTQGMDQWNPSRGFRPSSYLMSRANGQVLHYRRDRSRTVRIPWRLQDLYVSGRRLQQARIQQGLPPLNDEPIAVRLKVSPQRWLDACAADADYFKKVFHGMLKRGIYLAPSAFESLFISRTHSKELLDKTLLALDETLQEIEGV